MNIINIVEDSILGSLICFADENWEPMKWGKYLKHRLFLKESMVNFGFHLYFCNVNFDTSDWEKEFVNERKKMIWNVYQEFLLNGYIVEDILFEEISDGIFLEEEGFQEKEIKAYQSKYRTKEKLFKNITTIEVRIYVHDYAVIVSLPFMEEKVAIVVKNLFDKEKRYGYIIPEEESEPVEMDYRRKNYLLLESRSDITKRRE